MNQRKLMLLLREAASPDCTDRRRNQIQVDIVHVSPAMGPDGVYTIDGPEAGMKIVLEHLYVDTLKNKPHLLPTLFPVFAMICGDRGDGSVIADVDWSLV